jgi:hypothetical protein
VSSLLTEVAELVASLQDATEGTPARGEVDEIADRLSEPLRIAIAGKAKAGKSTLLNALVGEVLAPTDASECTRVVTWYQEGLTYRARMEPVDGPAVDAPVNRTESGLEVDLGGRPAEGVARIVVEWPARILSAMTLIDTPGIGSLSGIGDRTLQFLAPEDERPSPADAVIYLTRHLHAGDVRFLEAFHDDTSARATPVNALCVLSRADEIGAARADALESAARIAARYRADPRIRRFCHTVVPVAALLAQASATLTEAEFKALGRLSELDDESAAALLLSADRFVDPDAVVGLAPSEREYLIRRLGMFGVRLSCALLRTGQVDSAGRLAQELRTRSGLDELRRLLAGAFSARRDLLKARSAMLGASDITLRYSFPERDRFRAELERIHASAHELAELRLLTAIRSGSVALTDKEVAEVEQLLGPAPDIAARLGLPAASPEDVRAAVVDGVHRWRARAESPLATPTVVDACQVVTRSLEGVIAATTQ